MAIEIKKLTSADTDLFIKLITVFEKVFGWDNPGAGPLHLKKVLSNKHFIVFIAVIDNKVVGGLTAHVLERYDAEKPSAYIYDIAVIKEMQRKGIGKSLVTTFSEYCNENEFSEAFVQADIADKHAINFYRKTTINSELRAVHFTYLFDNY